MITFLPKYLPFPFLSDPSLDNHARVSRLPCRRRAAVAAHLL